ncbi:hypothetical protein FHX52_3264 [Humibacillus xanthopallidus]|uniref:RiboL-PSP-HEPN domain-containing protein n=1 Tax=Humibacillus xanthopallidus TaxID=412689 RepID=A0A543PR37_9MICO|nr:hypothetical protein FHX52_3264 [Humibacillus xanthopallidus]
MATLIAYHELHNALNRLRSRLSSPARPVARDADLLIGDAYLVSTHAAIEFFFEELSRRAVYASLWKLRTSRVRSPLLEAIAATHYYACATSLPRGDLTVHGSVEEETKAAIAWYIRRLDGNNGVKRLNLLAMLLPLGFHESDFDPVWLASMDSFGGLRGDTAHGRPVTRFGRPPVDIAPSGFGPIKVPVWSTSATRTRTSQAPWDIDRTLSGLLPEMRLWDMRVRSRF